MPYSRQRPKIAANGRVAVRLNTAQRDLFVRSPHTPRDLGHTLHRAPVRGGKLTVRVTRHVLDALITAAVREPAQGREEERELATLVRYLEGLADQFADPDAEEPGHEQALEVTELDAEPEHRGD